MTRDIRDIRDISREADLICNSATLPRVQLQAVGFKQLSRRIRSSADYPV